MSLVKGKNQPKPIRYADGYKFTLLNERIEDTFDIGSPPKYIPVGSENPIIYKPVKNASVGLLGLGDIGKKFSEFENILSMALWGTGAIIGIGGYALVSHILKFIGNYRFVIPLPLLAGSGWCGYKFYIALDKVAKGEYGVPKVVKATSAAVLREANREVFMERFADKSLDEQEQWLKNLQITAETGGDSGSEDVKALARARYYDALQVQARQQHERRASGELPPVGVIIKPDIWSAEDEDYLNRLMTETKDPNFGRYSDEHQNRVWTEIDELTEKKYRLTGK